MSDEGVGLLKRWEGLKLEAYPDPATGGEPWTIGYGHTRGVSKGQRITLAQAERLLREDLERFELGVEALVTAPISQGQFDALVSLAFNIGLVAFKNSTLLRKLNLGQHCADEFMRWNRAGYPRRVINGLTARRFAERALFLRSSLTGGVS
jgi:lysozyme